MRLLTFLTMKRQATSAINCGSTLQIAFFVNNKKYLKIHEIRIILLVFFRLHKKNIKQHEERRENKKTAFFVDRTFSFVTNYLCKFKCVFAILVQTINLLASKRFHNFGDGNGEPVQQNVIVVKCSFMFC